MAGVAKSISRASPPASAHTPRNKTAQSGGKVGELAMLDLKITGGTIVDGTGAERYQGDLGIRDGRIVALGEVTEEARKTIDASGKVVAPGFVDVHTHYDAQVFWDPTLSPSCYHGITTVVGGFCGFSIAPLSEESGAYLMPMLARVEGMPLESLAAATDWSWRSFADYLGRIEGTLAINAGFVAGHSAIRRHVMGPAAIEREATPEEIETMQDLLRESIRGGALGFSSTLSVTHNDPDGNPVPSRHASREEVLALYSVCSEFEGTIAELLPSLEFDQATYDILTDASLAAQRPVNWNAVGTAGRGSDEKAANEHKLKATDYARSKGAEVIALAIPCGATIRLNMAGGMVFDAFNGWAPLFRHSIPERIELLRDPAYRAELRDKASAEAGLLQRLAKWDNLRVAEVFNQTNRKYEGRMICDIAAEEGRDPFDVFCDIAIADELKTSFMPQFPEDTAEIAQARVELIEDSRTVAGASDAGAHLDMNDTFAFATGLLGSAMRRFGAISLERAVYNLTDKPARLFGLRKRGQLKEGWHADVVVFDPDTVGPGETYTRTDLPAGGMRLYSDPTGIHHVVVNGREIIRDSQYLGTPAGEILRPGVSTYTVSIPAAREKELA
jgi:N-acyl-D-aspartate/D-glutamate deacylase